jgi:hypothetical protein
MSAPEITYRVIWLPGSDELRAVCHCGAEHLGKDPVEIWQWLLAHPEGHEVAGGGEAPVANDPGVVAGAP